MGSLLKEIYEKTAEYEAFYTGGDIQWTTDGGHFLCQCNDVIKVVDVNTFCNILTIGEATEEKDECDQIYTFKMSHNNLCIITAHKSGLIKQWDKESGRQQKVWRAGHKGAVAKLAFDQSDTNVASGGTDGNIRIWDLSHNTCTSSLRGAVGVFTVLKYHPDSSKPLLFGAADDTKIRSWDSRTGKDVMTYSGHFSKVTSLQFTPDNEYMVSSGRDRVLVLWKLDESKALKVIPVYESIETTVLMPASFKVPNFKKKVETEGIYVACAGEKGVVKIWNVQMSRLMFEQTNSLVSAAADDGGLAVAQLLYNEARDSLAVATADQNIIIHDLETFACTKQMVGFTDEILDIIFVGKDERHIVVATNSRDLKHYELGSMNCKLVKGHTDIVLALASFPTKPEAFVSSGKDNSVRIWFQDGNDEIRCFGVGAKHTASVGSVFTAQTSVGFFVSASQDGCLKVWSVPEGGAGELAAERKIKSTRTELAHGADVNCVAVSPNDQIVATGSQDKTAKLWTEDLSPLGTLRGHRRGVWCVRFSPADRVVLTTSADCTLKLWSIADLACLKTFEGHESSALGAVFLSRGQQILSSGADGLLKLWNVKTSECKMSLDNHDGKIWSLAVNASESVAVTGGSDSKLVVLRDVSAEKRDRSAREREELALQEQELANLLRDKRLLRALQLAARTERPLHALRIVNEMLKSGRDELADALARTTAAQKEALLRFATEWNTNNRNCHAAQLVLRALAPQLLAGALRVPSAAALVEAALPYTQRHFERLTALQQELQLVAYAVRRMQPHAGADA